MKKWMWMTTMWKPIISVDFNRFPVRVPITLAKHKKENYKKTWQDYNLTKDWRSLRYLNELVMLLLFYHMTFFTAVVFRPRHHFWRGYSNNSHQWWEQQSSSFHSNTFHRRWGCCRKTYCSKISILCDISKMKDENNNWIRCAAQYFSQISRCLEMRSSTVLSVWSIFSFETKTDRLWGENGEIRSKKSMLLRTHIQKTVTFMTWQIIKSLRGTFRYIKRKKNSFYVELVLLYY